MDTVVDPETSRKRSEDGTVRGLLVSLTLHLLVLFLLPGWEVLGVAGVPGGGPRTDVYSLDYLGEWHGDADGRPAPTRGETELYAQLRSQSPRPAAKKATSKPVPSPFKAVVPAKIAPAKPEKVRAITSAKGEFALPAAEPDETKVKRSVDPATTGKESVGPVEAKVQPVGGIITGHGSGPVPPPAGESLLAVGSLPAYPKNAANEGVEGTVHLRITVAANGRVALVEVARGSGDRRLDDIAVRTVSKSWQLKPYAQDYVLNVSVEFKAGTRVRLDYGAVELVPAPAV